MLSKIPFRLRITLLFTVITGFTLLVFSGLLYRAFTENQQAEFDASIYNHSIDIAQGISFDFFGNLALESTRLSESEKVFPYSPGKALLQIRRTDGAVLARSRSASRVELPLTEPGFTTIRVEGQTHRMLTYELARESHLVLQLAVPTVFLDRERRNLLVFFSLAIPAVLFLSAFGGLWLSRRALAPVTAITDTARRIAEASRISGESLASRVPVPKARDEHHLLAQTLNELLSRLQNAFESHDHFIANASHQLRTPLAILRGELDLIRSKERSKQEIDEFLSSASQEIDYLARVVEDLLMLARFDSGAPPESLMRLSPIRLDDAIMEVVSRLQPFSRAHDVQLVFNVFAEEDAEATAQGDPELLQSLLRNLIENAIKYSGRGTRVDVRLEERAVKDEACWRVSVLDQGPGIPPADLTRIFERFYRGSSTSQRISGSGLGLSIAKKIAELHQGTLTAENLPMGGSAFRFEIKKS